MDWGDSRFHMYRFVCATLLISALSACSDTEATAGSDALLIFGGEIVTLDTANPSAEAVLVHEGKVLALGGLVELAALPEAAGAQRHDLAGDVLYPGFVDGHAHLVGIGLNQMQVDLMGTGSYAEVIERVQSFVREKPPVDGAWIIGRGWDQNDWQQQDFPNHAELSAAFPDRAVVLSRVDGHAILANAAAMQRAGIDASTQAPEGGAILRDAAGEPTGVFIDNAEALVLAHQPAGDLAELEQAIRLAAEEMQRRGLTAIHDAGISRETVEICQELARQGELGIRVYGMVPGSDLDALDSWFASGPLIDARDQVTVRAIKVYADGALGSRGAAMLEEYSDDPGNRGLLVTPAARIQEIAERALASGFQVNTHAIGDRGNRVVLDAYETAISAARSDGREVDDHRFRVEHVQILAPADIPRFRQLGVIPSMQTQHQSSDMPWAEERVGAQRIRGAYAWRSLIDTGVVICGGSDAPVERLNPLASFRAAVARVDENGLPDGGWYPDQRMTRQEGLLQLTAWPAYAAFQEQRSGQISPGMHADFTVLSGDLRQVSVDEIDEVEVRATIFAGRIVYQAGAR